MTRQDAIERAETRVYVYMNRGISKRRAADAA